MNRYSLEADKIMEEEFLIVNQSSSSFMIPTPGPITISEEGIVHSRSIRCLLTMPVISHRYACR